MADHGDLGDGVKFWAWVVPEGVEVETVDGFDDEFEDELESWLE